MKFEVRKIVHGQNIAMKHAAPIVRISTAGRALNCAKKST
jgi:hypothetical protein